MTSLSRFKTFLQETRTPHMGEVIAYYRKKAGWKSQEEKV